MQPPASIPASRRRVLVSLLPTGVFLAVDHWWGLTAAILSASALSASVVLMRWRRRQAIGVILPATLAYVVIRGAAAAILDSEDVYFGFGLAIGTLAALAIGATAFGRTPAAALFIPAVAEYRDETIRHPVFRRVAAQVTVAWVVMDLVITGWEAWHLTRVDAVEFVALRTFVGWPVMAGWICCLIFYVRLRLDPVQYHLVGYVPDIRGRDPRSA